MTLTPDEHDALARWVRAVSGTGYMAAMIDKEILPVVSRLLEEAEVSSTADPYAGKRTVVRGEDVIGGRDDRGITRKSERKST